MLYLPLCCTRSQVNGYAPGGREIHSALCYLPKVRRCSRWPGSGVRPPGQRCSAARTTNGRAVKVRLRRVTATQSSSKRDKADQLIEKADMSEIGRDEPSLLTAQLCLCGVAILWGTYSPVVRYIYASKGAPSPAALTAIRTVIQAVVLLASNAVVSRQQLNSAALPIRRSKALRKSSSSSLSQSRGGQPRALRSLARTVRKALNSTTDVLWVAGVELGLWNFCGSTFQAVGLQYTTATRGAFLIQATSLLTPIMATIAGEKPSRGVWLGCCCTLVGTVLITLDHTAPAVSDSGSANLSIGGDSLVLAAALFYSLVTVRLGRNAQRFAAVPLAASKSLAIAVIAVAWLPCTALFETVTRGEAAQLWPGWQNPAAWLAIVWSALGPGALVAYLQSQPLRAEIKQEAKSPTTLWQPRVRLQGQATVPAAQSQVIYSSVPVWSALLAFGLMPEETMGVTGYFGGVLIVVAGLLAIVR